MCKSLYPIALGSEERTQAFVSANVEIKNKLLESRPQEIVVIVASMKKKKTLMKRDISIARWELSNLTKSGAPQIRQRAAVHTCPTLGPISDGSFSHTYIMIFSCFASSPSRNVASKFIVRRASNNNVFSS